MVHERKQGRGGEGGRRFTTARKGGRVKDEFEAKMIQIDRVTRVTGGGKRMRFRATVVVGNRKGKVGVGIMKGPDVAIAIQKATTNAKKHLITVPIYKGSIPHEVRSKYHAARIMLKPAPLGTGLKSGGAVRSVLELAGIENVVSKMFGSANRINNLRATIQALEDLREPPKSKKDVSPKETSV